MNFEENLPFPSDLDILPGAGICLYSDVSWAARVFLGLVIGQRCDVL